MKENKKKNSQDKAKIKFNEIIRISNEKEENQNNNT